MSDSLTLQGLSFGKTIELYYTIVLSNSIKHKVWWPAVLEKLNFLHDKRGATLSGVLKFRPMHGFKAATIAVTFGQDNQLRDKHNIQYSWRFPLQQHDSNSICEDVVSGGRETSTDEDYSPSNDVPILGKRTKKDMRNSGCDSQNETNIQHRRKEQDSLNEIRRLQKDVAAHASLIAKLYADSNISKYEEEVHLVPLHFLRSRLAPALEKAPSIPLRVSASEFRMGFAFFSQEHLRKGCDCTLLQFDGIADHIHRTLGETASFFPAYDTFKSTPQQEVRVRFDTFASLAAVFAPQQSSILNGVVVKKKIERSSGIVTAVRILGSLVQSEKDETLPMFATVGTSFPLDSESSTSRKVIKRSSTKWNAIEGMFNLPLTTESMSVSSLMEEAKNVLVEEELSRQRDKSCFCIIWKRETHLHRGKLFTPPPDPRDVLGTLEVVVPFVLVKEQPHCEEICNLLAATDLQVD